VERWGRVEGGRSEAKKKGIGCQRVDGAEHVRKIVDILGRKEEAIHHEV